MDRTALAQKVLKAQPFSQHPGMEPLSAGEEEVELALPVRPEFYQHLGVGRAVQAGKRLAVVQGEVYSGEPEPKLVALGQGTIAKV